MLEGECDASRLYLKRETSIENRIRVISKMKSNKPLPTEGSFANLKLEGDGDALRLYLKCKLPIANRTRVILENKRQQTVTSPKPASPIEHLKVSVMLCGYISNVKHQ
jgi:hypothetical protein